jgi:hypothetical protein
MEMDRASLAIRVTDIEGVLDNCVSPVLGKRLVYFMKETFLSFLKCSSPVTTRAFFRVAVA